MESKDFYYKCTRAGAKRYYNSSTGRMIRKDSIPISLIDHIKEIKEDHNQKELLLFVSKRDKLRDKILLTYKQLDALSDKRKTIQDRIVVMEKQLDALTNKIEEFKTIEGNNNTLDTIALDIEGNNNTLDTIASDIEGNNSSRQDNTRFINECSICYENEINTVLDECGHGFCSSCTNNLVNKLCPNCRKEFKRTIRIFL